MQRRAPPLVAARTTSLAARAIAGWLAASAVGCSSSYVPAASPHLTMVMDDGSLAYVRDGHRYTGGLFGGDLEEAVRGNPRAEAYAREYKTGMITGFVLSILGCAGAVGGLAVFGSEEAAASRPTPAPGLAMIGAGLITEIVGVALELRAQPHLFDAINAYNDGLTSGVAMPAPANASQAAGAP